MAIFFDMTVEVWDQQYTNHYLDIHYNDMEIKFEMKLLPNLTLDVEWKAI